MINVIITGVTGQDGSHMCDYLLHHFSSLDKPYKIYGTVRRLSVKNHENILHLKNNPNFELIDMDLSDAHSIRDIIIDVNPDYFINFAAQSFVAGSWKYPVQTWNTDANAVMDFWSLYVDLLLIVDFIMLDHQKSSVISFILPKMNFTH